MSHLINKNKSNSMSGMFCFSASKQQAVKAKIRCMRKKPEVALKHDELTCALIGLARAAEGKQPGRKADELMMQGFCHSHKCKLRRRPH